MRNVTSIRGEIFAVRGEGCPVQCEEKVYSIRRATSGVRGQCVWLGEKVYIIRNFTSAAWIEKVCTTRRFASAEQGEGCTV